MALILACVGLAGLGIWHSSALQRTKHPIQKPSQNEMKAAARARLQRGVGSQVKLAAAGDSAELVRASVDSVAQFIFERSNLNMSVETKMRLAQAEEQALNGNGSRLNVDKLAESLTASVTTRLAALSDKEIERAANAFHENAEGRITMRASGKLGTLTRADFIRQAKAGREWGRRGDAAIKTALGSMIRQEVADRFDNLAASLPEQFGRVSQEGATPVQALLIAYSVATDDPLEGSQSDLRNQLVEQRMFERKSPPAQAEQRAWDKAFGVNGFIYSTPVDLFFDKTTLTQLLAEGGSK
ncbi:MAG: hypothetical protein JO360_08670 [Acidobacteria bacterium]|nr:hypothetical protein [Acidobacteriota bacterium]